MRKPSTVLPLTALLLTLSFTLAQAHQIEELKAGVVKITATVQGKTKVGTGIIVQLESDAAHIVTASHVIEGDPEPRVAFFTRPNRPLEARVIGLEGGDPRGLAGLRALPIDQSVQLSGGEPVTVIGFPRHLGTAWAVTTGSITGLRGRAITFQAPADEGNSGGPLILNDRVVGIITESTGQFGYAVPIPIVQIALSSWGIRLARASRDTPSPELSATTRDELSELDRLEAAIRESGSEATAVPDSRTAAAAHDVTGVWSHTANPLLTYLFEQQGDTVEMAEISTTVMGALVTAQGEGRLSGRTVRIGYWTSVGTTGETALTVSDDGESMSGTLWRQRRTGSSSRSGLVRKES